MTKPWERNWDAPDEAAPTSNSAAKPWERDWSAEAAPTSESVDTSKSGLSASLLDDQFKSGVAGMQSGYFANNAKNAGALLASMDRIDRGERLSMEQDPLGYQDMSPEQRKQVRAQFDQNITSNVAKAVKYDAEQKSYDKNPNADLFIKQANNGNYADAWRTFNSDKLGILQQLTVSNAAQAIPQIAGGGLGVALRGGLPGLMAGMATGSYPMEYIASISESLQESGVDMEDIKAVEAKLRDPEFIKQAGNRATTRGTVIAAADAASGKLLTPLKGGEWLKNAGRATGNLGKEVGLEMGTEAGAQVATDGTIKVGDVLAEGLGAGPQAVATTAWKTIAESRKPAAPTVADIASATNPQEAVAVASAALDAPVAGQDVTADELDQLESAAGMAPVGQAPAATPPAAGLLASETGNPVLEQNQALAITPESVAPAAPTDAGIPTSTTEPDVWRFGADKITPEPVASNNIVYRNQAEADAAVAAGRAQQSAAQRLSIMDEVLGSEAAVSMPPKQLVKAFSSALAAQGFTDTAPTAQEAARLERGAAARDAMLEADSDVIPAAPNEMDVESLIPERKQPVQATDPLGRVKTLIGQGYTLQGKQLASPAGERVNLSRQELLYVKSNRKGKADADRNANGTADGLYDGRAGSVESRAADTGLVSGPAAGEAVAQDNLQGRSNAEVTDAADGKGNAGADTAANGQRTLKRVEAVAGLERMSNKQLRAESAKKGTPVWKRTAIADILQVRAEQSKQNRSNAQRKVYAKARGIDPDRDDIAKAVAKLGGIDSDSAKGRLNLAPEELNRRGFGVQRMFKRGGRSFDEVSELLAEMGFVDRDENGKADPQDAADKIAAAAGGDAIYTPNGMMIRAEEERARAAENAGVDGVEAYGDIEDIADAGDVIFDDGDADAWLQKYEADLAADPDVDFSTAGQVEFEAENEPFSGPSLMSDEDIDHVAEQLEAAENEGAAAGGVPEVDPRGQTAGRAEGTGTQEQGAAAGQDGFALTGESKQEGELRLERELAEVKAQQAEILRRMDEEKAEREQREIAARQEASADNFELGQDAMDSLTGQKGLLFSKAPAVGSAAFKRWFDGSAVVDENGEPMVVYHGSNAQFNVFNTESKSVNSTTFGDVETERTGAFFTDNPEFANQYGSDVRKFYLSIKNPAEVTRNLRLDFADSLDAFGPDRDLWMQAKNGRSAWGLLEGELGRRFKAFLTERGHDGVVLSEDLETDAGDSIESTTYVAFDPAQIKSATDNNGEFDGSNPDIRKSVGTYRTGNTVAAIERSIAGLRAKWQGFRNIEVVQSVADLPANLREIVEANGSERTEGFYDPSENTVWMIADNIAKDRSVWVAAHETAGHGGLRALGDKGIDDAIRFAGKNRYIADLASAITRDRGDDSNAVEEALSELQAAIVTNDFSALEDRYGIAVPEASRNGIRGSIGRVLAAIRKWLADVMGIESDAVSDADVRALLDDARKAVETAGVYQTGRMEPAMASVSPELASELQAAMDGMADKGMVNAPELLEWLDGRNEPGAVALSDWLAAMGDSKVSTSSVVRYLDMTGHPMFSQSEDDYRIDHRAPSRDAGAPMHDLSDVYPDDLYGPRGAQFYGHFGGGDKMDAATVRMMRAYRGNPDAPLKIYRAVPSGVQSDINPGDWVTINKDYAIDHGERQLDGDYRIIEKMVKAKDIYTNGDSIHEWGYDPEDGVKLSVAPKQTDTAAFKRWFGQSKVVNEDGSPMVVYHGSASTDITQFLPEGGREGQWQKALDHFLKAQQKNERYGYMNFRSGSFFSPHADYAGNYTRENSGVMYPVYIKAENPIYFDQRTRKITGIDPNKTPDALIMHDDGVINEVAVIDPSQVKSATGNNGDFDPTKPDIRFSKAPKGQQALPGMPAGGGKSNAHGAFAADPRSISSTWKPLERSKKSDWIYALQNKHIDTKEVVARIRAGVTEIEDKFDPDLQETLFAGRAATRTTDFAESELKPLMEAIDKAGVSMEQFERYLHNRHAEEANIQVAKIDPDFSDGGSGIKTADARAYLKALSPEQRAKYEALAEMVYGITKKTRDLLVVSGLESQEMLDRWTGAYKHYVPLFRENEDEVGLGIGNGFSVRGSSSERRVGSMGKVEDILANVAMQRERAIIRAEKNRIGVALYGLALKAPNPDWWMPINPGKQREGVVQELVNLGLHPTDAEKIIAEPIERRVNPVTGIVEERVNPLLRNSDNVLFVRIGGADRFIIFNKKEPRAVRMAQSLKNLDAENLGVIMNGFAKVSRYFAAINTQYNPIFGGLNFIRDIQGAALNLTNSPITGKQAAVMKEALRLLGKSTMKGVRIKNLTDEDAALYDEFRKYGGQTGFRDMFADSDERARALRGLIDPEAWMDSKLGKFFTANGKMKVPYSVAQKAGGPLFRWLSDYNETMENVVRVATYKVAKENGLSKERAAALAKVATVNFNRRGSLGLQAGALYAFFNASVQGTHTMYKTLTGPAGKAIIAGGVTLGIMQASILALAGFDDDEPKEFVKARNIVIPLGGGKYGTWPMPLGYNILVSAGRIPAEWAISGGKNGAEKLLHLIEVVLDNTIPIGNSGLSGQTVSPTATDPIIALLENRDWTGNKIAKEDRSRLDPTPGYTRAKDTATAFSKSVSHLLNNISGGNDYVPGLISPTPDQLDYLGSQIGGGVAREVIKIDQTVRSFWTGEDLPSHKWPVLGRFYGTLNDQAGVTSEFYNNVIELNRHQREIKGLKEDKGDVDSYRAKHPGVERLAKQADELEREISKLRKDKRKAVEAGESRDQVKLIEQKITDKMTKFNAKVEASKKKDD